MAEELKRKLIVLFLLYRSRKLNSVLETAIQQAMAELDRTSAKAKTQTGNRMKRRAAAMEESSPTVSPTRPRRY